MANPQVLTNTQPNSGQDSPETPFNLVENAWTINNWPPVMSPTKESISPTAEFNLAKGLAQPIPFSGVNAKDSKNTTEGWLTYQKIGPNGPIVVDGGITYWDVFGGNHIYFGIKSPCPYDVNLIFNMRVRDTAVSPSTSLSIWINGEAFTPTSGQQSTDTNWHTQVLPIPSGMLQGQGDINNIMIEPMGTGANISSVTLQVSDSKKLIPIQASYYWEQFDSGVCWQSMPKTYPVTVENGVYDQGAEPASFVEALGYPVNSFKLGKVLAEATESLNAAFTATQGSENSVDLAAGTTSTRDFIFEVNGGTKLNFQLWRLVVKYEITSGDSYPVIKYYYGKHIFIRTLVTQG